VKSEALLPVLRTVPARFGGPSPTADGVRATVEFEAGITGVFGGLK
jgi:hypothetical protein